MDKQFSWTWNVEAIARAFEIDAQEVKGYLTDGRRVSFLIERRLQKGHDGWKLAKSEGAGFDLMDPKGGKWEVRSITKGGVYFNPSNQVGKGRAFDEGAFQKKLGSIKGFILADIDDFPRVRIYVIETTDVIEWHKAGRLGANAKVSRTKFLEELWPAIR